VGVEFGGRWSSRFSLIGGPPLVGGLAADTDPQRDIGPAVALGTKPVHGGLDGALKFAFQAEELGEFVDVTGGDATGLSTDDTARKSRVVVIFHSRAGSPFRCPRGLDAPGTVCTSSRHVSVCTPRSEFLRIERP
jgi:hypothetical protein